MTRKIADANVLPKALLVFLATILPASAGETAILPSLAEPLRFAWPVSAKVKVTDRSVKEGTEVVVSYDVSLGPAPDGKRLAVRMSGFEFWNSSAPPRVERQGPP